MQQLIKYIIEGWPTRQQDVIQQLQSYHTFKEEMSVIDGLVFKGERIIIPIALQDKALKAIHRSHMGIQKTLDRSKGCFYWSGISKDITHICETCEECLKYANRQQKEPKGQVRDVSEVRGPESTIYHNQIRQCSWLNSWVSLAELQLGDTIR